MKDLRFFIRMMQDHRGWVISGAVLTFTTLVASIALLTLAGWFITASALVGLAGTSALIGFNYHYASGGIRAFALTRVVSRYAERLVTHEATFRILAQLRHWFFSAVLPLSPGQLTRMRSGDVLTRITGDIDALDNLYLRLLVPSLVAAVAGLCILIFMGLYSLWAALAMGLGLALVGILLPRWGQRRGMAPGEKVTRSGSDLRTSLVDAVEGLGELLAFGAAKRQHDMITRRSETLLQARATMARLTATTNGMTVLIAQLTVVFILVIGAALIGQGSMSGPILALLAFCALAGFEAVMPLSQAWTYLGRTQQAARRLLDVAETEPMVRDASQPAPIPEDLTLSLDGVSFTYPEGARPAVEDVSWTLKPGDKIALIGPSGGGKSTLLSLLLRLYDPGQGTVRLGGTDLRALPQRELWNQIGFLSQRSDLFSASIRGNILLGRPDASEEALARAVKLAGLEHFVAAQPEGLETWVGENGVLVSGGEARRIALARVILKNAPILLLDEPTEGLDAATERDVLRALGDISADKTVLLVTHRLQALAGMQETWIMENGSLKRHQ